MQSLSFDLNDVKTVYDSSGNQKEVILSYQKFRQIKEFLFQFRTDNQNESQRIDNQEKAAMDREEAAYRRLHPALFEEYAGQYVAIYGGELVDHDKDQVELYLRVKSRYSGKFVWIAPVRPEPEETYAVRSPRFVGAD
jgi:hypothetical protein